MQEKPPLKTIIDAWHSDQSEIRRGDGGTPYAVIPNAKMMESFKVLIKTLLNYGYTYDEMDSHSVSLAIANKCWQEDRIKKISTSDIRKAKKNLTDDWDAILHSPEFSGIIISTLEESEKVVPVEKTEYKKSEKDLDLNPRDRLQIDASDIPDAPLDLDFLEEIDSDE